MVVRRKKTTIHLNAKETISVLEVKRMIEGILKVPPENQMLLKHLTEMEDDKTLGYYNLNGQTARAHTPASLGLCLRDPGMDEPEAFNYLFANKYHSPSLVPSFRLSIIPIHGA
ncbi:unnamed protein product [Echinostoma caproni]|uniref:Ubiquitin-like domain-containing protein n=1 Tax=Echinostoma caproni TaxID=27848 RepID=A0A183A189_9TREM|nr:unnamed protein product [Echinostoma caproni]